jgi:hypothetical protein
MITFYLNPKKAKKTGLGFKKIELIAVVPSKIKKSGVVDHSVVCLADGKLDEIDLYWLFSENLNDIYTTKRPRKGLKK